MSSLKVPKILWFDKKNWILMCFEWTSLICNEACKSPLIESTQSEPIFFFFSSSSSSTVIINIRSKKHSINWDIVSSLWSLFLFFFYSVDFVIIINDTYKKRWSERCVVFFSHWINSEWNGWILSIIYRFKLFFFFAYGTSVWIPIATLLTKADICVLSLLYNP